ncbi:hypothetical protein BATDEDRAFT_28982 [Batrachochytrium dendrobatidis JAM81]|uniref:Uncharacterized protein n=2 Tax=Batrachochytrium dendrobatidis TaxID=109871 RepID=F4PFU4_BATDJ|nr:uncharacterized protein BATDEDRAFT_28982 [Batrachochytrium dendrobatidis JAM81]EGF75899.1 hypothetical protein BATDEDRAFT_28982 [Batrachochytrium dendrobatidis JAM81]OAJ44860.1 hypothetical protein BDEG_28048 [Batrachochytrium dendrobatidis JEL423]|eukprot:XP_006683475.1 hypothetical protein BATDEDRAFT_28982 [Batrachochytrium dendrobatidis JAM81]
MRLTDILLALTLVVTSSMAVVPPSENVQKPQSNQNPRCQPGSSNGCQPTISSPSNIHESSDQVQKRYEDLQKQVEDAKENMKRKCDEYHKSKNELISSQTDGGLGLGSFFGKFLPDSIKNKFGKTSTLTKNSLFYLDFQCIRAKRICKLNKKKLQKFKRTHGIGFMAKLYNFFQWFKN